MRRFAVAGYYGFGNLGDEMILAQILAMLTSAHPKAAVTVLSADPRATRRDHAVRAANRWNPLSVAAAVRSADTLVLGGGGLFQDGTSRRSLAYYLSLMAAGTLGRRRTVLFALGVESLASPFLRSCVRRLLRRPRVTITVRDDESKRLLVASGVPDAAIAVTADPVFAVAWPTVPAASAVSGGGLIPRYPHPAAGRRLYQFVADGFFRRFGVAATTFLFQPSREVRCVTGSTLAPGRSWTAFKNGVQNLSTWLGSIGVVASARFHGLIAAATAGRPFIGLGLDEKAGRLCGAFSMPFLPWQSEPGDVDRAIGEALRRGRPDPRIVARFREASSRTSAALR